MSDRVQAAPNTRRTTYFFAAALAVGSMLPLWAAANHHTFLNDDTYITLVYAKNLAQGNGFVYNHPPASLGTTSPALALIVAALSRLLTWVDTDVIAVYFTALCWAASAWTVFLFRNAWRLAAWEATVVSFAILGTGWIGFLGMEAYLFAFLLMLSISLYYAERPFLSGLSVGILYLTRGEGILIWILLMAVAAIRLWASYRRHESVTLRDIALLTSGFAIPVVLWSAYAMATFGSVLPNTLAAKRAQGAHAADNLFLLRLLQEWLPRWGTDVLYGRQPFLNVWWLLVAVGVLSAFIRQRRWLILLAWVAAYIAGYGILRVSGYWWYQLPILFVAHAFLGLGLVAASRLAQKHLPTSIGALASSLLAITIVAGLLYSVAIDIRDFRGDPRGPSYVGVGSWLRENTHAYESVAFIEIGYLGYFSDNRIVDLAGLVVPEIVSHYADGDFTWGFWEYRPDYYIYDPGFDWMLGDIVTDVRFTDEYYSVATLPGPNDRQLTIFHRRPTGASRTAP